MLPHLILNITEEETRARSKVKVTTMLKVTWLLRSRVRIQRKTAKVTIQALSHKLHLPLRFHWELRRVSRQPTQFLSILPIRMTEKSTRPEHSYRQNKGWTLTGTELLCPLWTPAPSAHLCPRWLITWASLPTGFQLCLITGRYLQETGGQKGRQYLLQSAPVPNLPPSQPMALQLCHQ